jgi:ankyrin repeat protein
MVFLLNHGANSNHKDNKGLTPLHWAATKGHDHAVDLLVFYLSRFFLASVDLGKKSNWILRNSFSIMLAHFQKLRSGADPLVTSVDGKTPAQLALERGHWEVSKFLEIAAKKTEIATQVFFWFFFETEI